MRSIQLAPVRHEEPDCLDYDDESEVRRFEVAMRIHRAYVEAYSVTPLDTRVDGAYRVVCKSVGSGASWVVDVVDGSGTHDACTCPDFLGNDLGTCKHLEAVRRAITKVPKLHRAFGDLRPEPSVATLTVAVTGGARVMEVGRWTPKLRARVVPTIPGFRDTVRIVHAAPQVAARCKERSAISERRLAIEGALRAGRLRLDLLRQPLFSYQERGAAHLAAGGRALLADDMGLGKTIQAIAACELLRARGEASRVLIVTCASLKHQWQREIERFAGEQAVVVRGGRPERRAALESDAPYKILNYELTWHELSQLKSLDADVVVYDEAQRAKNFRTKTAATLRAIPSRFTFVLTGTPIENRLDDLYSLLQLIDPSVLGPLWRFNLEFAQQNERGRIVGYKSLSSLRQLIAPVVLRRRKEDVLSELPALTEQTRYAKLTAAQAELEMGYRTNAARLMQVAERRRLTKAEQDQLMMSLLKARQACNAVELCDPKNPAKASPKLDELEALLGEVLAQGSAKVLVFSEWVEMLKLCAKRLDGLKIGYAMLHGGVATDSRPALLDRFREQSDVRVLLSTEAGGVGLNLQVASYVVHLDLPWNPARLDQRTSRAHRMGQTRGVTVTYLCAESGIERGIEGTLASKRTVRSAALDVASTVEAVETQSFNATLRQVREILEAVATPTNDTGVVVIEDAAAASPLPTPTSTPAGGSHHARERLRLARVVLDAGFPADAVRAAYDALAKAIASLLDEPPVGHGALIAAIYRDLLPAGRLPQGAHAVLATLHDLSSLDALGVPVAPVLAAQAVADAEQWVERVST